MPRSEETQRPESIDTGCLMGLATVFVFAYLAFPLGGLFLALLVPGALLVVVVARLHGLTGWRRTLSIIYGSLVNYGVLAVFSWGILKVAIYTGLASLGLALLCIESHKGKELSAVQAGLSISVGAAASLPLSLLMAEPRWDLGLLSPGLAGLVLIWTQYLLHSRYLVGQNRA